MIGCPFSGMKHLSYQNEVAWYNTIRLSVRRSGLAAPPSLLFLIYHLSIIALLYNSYEKRGTPEDAPPPIKIIDCRIINLPYYLAIMIVTRFSAFSAKGCTRAPLDSSVMRSEGILYFFVSIQTTAAARLAAMRSLMTSLPVPLSA